MVEEKCKICGIYNILHGSIEGHEFEKPEPGPKPESTPEPKGFEFEITITGNSGNTTINENEKEFIREEISNILQTRGITEFKVLINC
jgi:hypothetical protein